MKKVLLLTVVSSLFALSSNAQCIIDPQYADSAFGVWPDTIEDFMDGYAGVFYSDTLQFKIPTDGGDIDPDFAGFQIDSVALNSISGLPAGLTIDCNSHTPSPCTFIAGNQGCGLIEGITNDMGLYDLTIDVTAYAFVFGVNLPVPYTFEGYSLEILMSDDIAENNGNISEVSQNVPNPFNGETQINVALVNAAEIEFSVHDMVGKTLHERVVRGVPGPNRLLFDASELNSGIYLYTVKSNGQSVTKRMIVK